jgi:hypothetical protein
MDLGPDDGRELIVFIQSIGKVTNSATTSLLPGTIAAALDSSQPYIWLPVEACRLLERAFGIKWNDDAQLYLIDKALDEVLTAEDAKLSFRIGNAASSGETTVITLSYSSIVLTAQEPLVSVATRYFPLKRALNETQVYMAKSAVR